MLPDPMAVLASHRAGRGFVAERGTGLVCRLERIGGREAAVHLVPVGRTRYAGEIRYRQSVGFRC